MTQTDNDALVREKRLWKVICSLEAMSRNYAGGHMWDHLDGEMVCEAAALLRDFAALRSTPQAYPVSIGRLHLGEKRSNGERLCNWGHEVLVGHPLYWPQAISQYDDSDPCCIEHAIEQYASEAGYGADAPNLSATAAIAALDRHRAGDDALRVENARLREALENAANAIDEMFRYFDGGETRGSYDGKPERAQLRKAGYAVRAALTRRQG